MQAKTSDITRVYLKLGMDVNQSHHKMAYFKYEGKTIFKTRLSHGSGDAKAVNHIRQDFKLDEDKFRNLINCPLSKEDYIEILKAKGWIQ